MKKISVVVVGLLGILVVVGMGGVIWWRGVSGAPSTNEEEKRFLIVRGSSAERIGKELSEAGLVKDALAFKFYVQLKGLTKKIPPGEFRIAGNLKLGEVVEVLLLGPTQVWVTVPEGLRREEVVERVIGGLELSGQEAEKFRGEFMLASAGMEGYLFPDTYLFPRDVEASKVVQTMRTTFDRKFSYKAGQGLSLEEVVILASIVERETRSDEERPIVAGIYLKRLINEWPLDACATVQYVIGEPGNWWVQIAPEDREIDSVYNTYVRLGLPPGPISNPGLASLEAVVNSVESPYWFYIHDSEGEIHYAETIEEQNRNIEKYLK